MVMLGSVVFDASTGVASIYAAPHVDGYVYTIPCDCGPLIGLLKVLASFALSKVLLASPLKLLDFKSDAMSTLN